VYRPGEDQTRNQQRRGGQAPFKNRRVDGCSQRTDESTHPVEYFLQQRPW
jgi:hypothetical protein